MEVLSSVSPVLALGVLMGSGAVAVLSGDTRLALIAMTGQYLGAALLPASAGAGETAWLLVAVGSLACLILALGLRGQPKSYRETGALLPLPFRITALGLILLAAFILYTQWMLPYADSLTTLACSGLVGLFVAQAGLHRAPIRAGIAAMTLLTAASLYLYAAGGGLTLTAWTLAAHLMAGLAVGHLQSTWNAVSG